MSKHNKKEEVLVDSQDVEVVNEEVVAEDKEEKQPEIVETSKNEQNNKENKKDSKKDKKKKDKKPKQHKVTRKVKETTSELKKVSWLSFGQVCKRTSIVLGFVVLFTAVLFGIDRFLSWIYQLLITSITK